MLDTPFLIDNVHPSFGIALAESLLTKKLIQSGRSMNSFLSWLDFLITTILGQYTAP